MAEVFFGKLRDGTEVAIKCMRPGVRPLLEADLALMLRMGAWCDSIEPLRMLGLGRAAEEFCEHIQMQTDFTLEADHLRRFEKNFKGLENVRFPVPLFVTPDFLVLSKEPGTELAKVFRAAMGKAASLPFSSPSSSPGAPWPTASEVPAHLSAHTEGVQRELGIPEALSIRIATESLSSYMRMVFRDNFIHGDLHPGNIMVQLDSEEESSTGRWRQKLSALLPGGLGETIFGAVSRPFKVIILDAGLAIPLPRESVEALRSLTIAIIYADFPRAGQLIYDASPDTSNCLDPAAFKAGIAKAFRDCRKQMHEDGFVQVSDAVLESLRLVREHHVALDTTLTWTLLGMLSIEGSARQLHPDADCAKAASRYILTAPSLWRELRGSSWHTSRQMLLEMLMNKIGLDYWAFKNTSKIQFLQTD
ncbi:unnamed protein product [Polarella glacialis]|uniref:ABC1 atypical kinase-like domain-containing protein n=1 Tax=Polarella glacialis TaxID=89957 RepID=A0A813DMB3_POLGL|nr:unnamed protein product [Polarella glacialis]